MGTRGTILVVDHDDAARAVAVEVAARLGYRAIAAEDADLVVCLGDYIYERNFYDGPRKDTLGANREGEVQTLDEYRSKYRQYKSDPNLRAMHAAHSFVAIWDDHEVEDNYAGDDPDEANGSRDQTKVDDEPGPRRVPYLRRRKNGYRAFFEAMPRFRPRRPPVDDVAAYVSRGTAAAAWRHHATVTVFAAASAVAEKVPPAAGVVEPLDASSCSFTTGAADLTTLATHLGLLDVDFRVDGPPDLVAKLRQLADRYERAVSRNPT